MPVTWTLSELLVTLFTNTIHVLPCLYSAVLAYLLSFCGFSLVLPHCRKAFSIFCKPHTKLIHCIAFSRSYLEYFCSNKFFVPVTRLADYAVMRCVKVPCDAVPLLFSVLYWHCVFCAVFPLVYQKACCLGSWFAAVFCLVPGSYGPVQCLTMHAYWAVTVASWAFCLSLILSSCQRFWRIFVQVLSLQ